MYGERYMDTPEENPDGYAKARLTDKAAKLKSDLLIFHGTVDPVVVWQNSLSFLQNCVENSVLVDYFVYPGHEHNVSGKDRLHLYRKIAAHMKDNL
jgi:dipeptidyl-peptidase-4